MPFFEDELAGAINTSKLPAPQWPVLSSIDAIVQGSSNKPTSRDSSPSSKPQPLTSLSAEPPPSSAKQVETLQPPQRPALSSIDAIVDVPQPLITSPSAAPALSPTEQAATLEQARPGPGPHNREKAKQTHRDAINKFIYRTC